jgi:hypothetical protein
MSPGSAADAKKSGARPFLRKTDLSEICLPEERTGFIEKMTVKTDHNKVFNLFFCINSGFM